MPWQSAIYAAHFAHGARVSGAEVADVPALAALGRPPTLDDRIGTSELLDLIERLAARCGRDLPVVAARSIVDHDSPLFHLVGVSATAGQGLSDLVRFSPLLGDGFCYRLRPEGDEVVVALQPTREVADRPGVELLLEFELAAFAVGSRVLFAREDLAWNETWLRAADAPVAAMSEVVGRCRAGMPSTLARFPRSLLLLAPVGADPGMAGFLRRDLVRRLALRPPLDPTAAARVREHLYRHVHVDARGLACAAALGMSPRTLARRLGEEGTRFGELLDEVRLDLALAWLDEWPLHEISERLGYSEESAFRRAFRRWTGVPPSVARTRADPPGGEP